MNSINYANLFSNLNKIEVETKSAKNSLSSNEQVFEQQEKGNKKWRQKHFFSKHQIAFQLKKYLRINESSDYLGAQITFDKYFRFELKQAYKETQRLPKKIFVCGYCKEPFFKPSDYLKHCYIENCPVNHERSNYKFFAKDSSIQLNPQTLKEILSQKQCKSILQTPYSHQILLLSQFQQIQNFDQLSESNPNQYECIRCKIKIHISKRSTFISHCIFTCPMLIQNLQKKQHMLKQNKQPFLDFKQDILNFHININLLSVYQNGIIKFIQNSKDLNSPTQKKSLQISSINKLYQKNIKVQNQIKLLPLPFQISDQLFLGVLNTKKWDKIHEKRQIVASQIKIKLNNLYLKQRQYLENFFFCGICLNVFNSVKEFIAHCIIYLCQINYQKNSHNFSLSNKNEPFVIEDFYTHISQSDIQKIRDDGRIGQIKHLIISFKNQNQNNSQDRFRCGQCFKSFNRHLKKKIKFIHHCLKVCLSHNHQKTNFYFQLNFPRINDQQYQKIIMSHFYAMKIAEVSFGFKYVLCKNSKKNFDGDYVCGSCDTIFESQQEFVYHSIVVCQSLQNPLSSHLIRKIYNPNANLQKPTQNLISQIEQTKQPQKIPQKHKSQKKKKIMTLQDQKDIEQQSIISKNRIINSRKKDEIFNNEQIPIEHFERQVKIQDQKKRQSKDHSQKMSKIEQNSQIQGKQGLQKVQKQQNQSQKAKFTKILRFNVNFIPQSNKQEFYCAKCQKNYKNEIKYIQHFQQQNCQSYENPYSSHFYVTNQRMSQILSQTVFSNLKNVQKETKFPQRFTCYQPYEGQKIFCGCKQSTRADKIIHHNILKHSGVNLSDSYFEVRLNLFESQKKNSLVFMTSNYDKTNLVDEFVCPCKPWKKLSFESFSKHVLKRHEGRTPKFYMKLPDN